MSKVDATLGHKTGKVIRMPRTRAGVGAGQWLIKIGPSRELGKVIKYTSVLLPQKAALPRLRVRKKMKCQVWEYEKCICHDCLSDWPRSAEKKSNRIISKQADHHGVISEKISRFFLLEFSDEFWSCVNGWISSWPNSWLWNNHGHFQFASLII